MHKDQRYYVPHGCWGLSGELFENYSAPKMIVTEKMELDFNYMYTTVAKLTF